MARRPEEMMPNPEVGAALINEQAHAEAHAENVARDADAAAREAEQVAADAAARAEEARQSAEAARAEANRIPQVNEALAAERKTFDAAAREQNEAAQLRIWGGGDQPYSIITAHYVTGADGKQERVERRETVRPSPDRPHPQAGLIDTLRQPKGGKSPEDAQREANAAAQEYEDGIRGLMGMGLELYQAEKIQNARMARRDRLNHQQRKLAANQVRTHEPTPRTEFDRDNNNRDHDMRRRPSYGDRVDSVLDRADREDAQMVREALLENPYTRGRAAELQTAERDRVEAERQRLIDRARRHQAERARGGTRRPERAPADPGTPEPDPGTPEPDPGTPEPDPGEGAQGGERDPNNFDNLFWDLESGDPDRRQRAMDAIENFDDEQRLDFQQYRNDLAYVNGVNQHRDRQGRWELATRGTAHRNVQPLAERNEQALRQWYNSLPLKRRRRFLGGTNRISQEDQNNPQVQIIMRNARAWEDQLKKTRRSRRRWEGTARRTASVREDGTVLRNAPEQPNYTVNPADVAPGTPMATRYAGRRVPAFILDPDANPNEVGLPEWMQPGPVRPAETDMTLPALGEEQDEPRAPGRVRGYARRVREEAAQRDRDNAPLVGLAGERRPLIPLMEMRPTAAILGRDAVQAAVRGGRRALGVDRRARRRAERAARRQGAAGRLDQILGDRNGSLEPDVTDFDIAATDLDPILFADQSSARARNGEAEAAQQGVPLPGPEAGREDQREWWEE